MSPFHSNSIHQLPPGLSSFLAPCDLLELACTAKTIHHQVKENLQEQKAKLFLNLIYYFYYSNYQTSEQRGISLLRRYDNDYTKNISRIFCYLPEVFQFMNSHCVTSLDMGCTSDYGGYPESAFQRVSSNKARIKEVADQLLDLLSTNRHLEWCNLGLFDGIIDYSDIHCAIKNHPTIDRISMTPSRSTTYYNRPPKTLWRNRKNGTFYWNHWREAPEDE